VSLARSNLKEAYRSLVTAKQRTVLALIGIVIGIGSVIGMISIGGIVRTEALRQFMDMGLDVVTVSKSYQAGASEARFTLAPILELPARGFGVLEVAPYASTTEAVRLAGENHYLQVMGATASFFAINRLPLVDGRLLRDFDVNRQFCVVGAKIASLLRQISPGSLLGRQLLLGGRVYTVIGELGQVAEGGGMRPGGMNDSVFVPLTSALRFWPDGDVRQILARVDRSRDVAALRSDLTRHFARTCHGMAIEVRTAEEMIAAMQKQMALYTLLLGAIGSISLIVGGIGVMNVMLISVSERRSEIGVRRALGAQKADVQMQFIMESVALCLVGGLMGIFTGVGVSYAFARFSSYAFSISTAALLLGVVVSTAVGVFFGYYPARKAAGLDPIAALRGSG
jgi:putative ABC transport system permease protein